MHWNCTRVHSDRPGASVRWLACGVLFIALMAGRVHATVIAGSFIGSPSDPFAQPDKTRGGSTDVIGNLPNGFTTLITTRPNIVTGGDLKTVTFSAALPFHATDGVWYVMVRTPNAGIVRADAGLVQTVGGATIATVLTNVPFSLPAATGTELVPIPLGPWTLLDARDTIGRGVGSDRSVFSNSFLEQLSVPEPGMMALVGAGVVALAGFGRRRSPRC